MRLTERQTWCAKNGGSSSMTIPPVGPSSLPRISLTLTLPRIQSLFLTLRTGLPNTFKRLQCQKIRYSLSGSCKRAWKGFTPVNDKRSFTNDRRGILSDVQRIVHDEWPVKNGVEAIRKVTGAALCPWAHANWRPDSLRPFLVRLVPVGAQRGLHLQCDGEFGRGGHARDDLRHHRRRRIGGDLEHQFVVHLHHHAGGRANIL